VTDQWWNFFYLCGSSAATLTGLTFVAVTLGSTLIKKDNLEQINIYISPICFHFIHVFFLCCIMAVPGTNPTLIAGAAILSALWRLTKMPRAYSVVHAGAKKDDTEIDISDWVTVLLLPTTVYLALIVTGIGFLLDKPWAIYILAASCLALLLGSARGAWDTLVWIAATVR